MGTFFLALHTLLSLTVSFFFDLVSISNLLLILFFFILSMYWTYTFFNAVVASLKDNITHLLFPHIYSIFYVSPSHCQQGFFLNLFEKKIKVSLPRNLETFS